MGEPAARGHRTRQNADECRAALLAWRPSNQHETFHSVFERFSPEPDGPLIAKDQLIAELKQKLATSEAVVKALKLGEKKLHGIRGSLLKKLADSEAVVAMLKSQETTESAREMAKLRAQLERAIDSKRFCPSCEDKDLFNSVANWQWT